MAKIKDFGLDMNIEQDCPLYLQGTGCSVEGSGQMQWTKLSLGSKLKECSILKSIYSRSIAVKGVTVNYYKLTIGGITTVYQ